VAEPLRQLNKPLAVPARLDPDQRWRLKGLIEPFRLSFPVLQLVLDDLAGLHIETAICCQQGWKSHPTIFIEGFS